MTAQGTATVGSTSLATKKGRRALGVALAVAVLAVTFDQGSKVLAVAVPGARHADTAGR